MPDFTYDVLLAYARADAAWVHIVLLPRLKTVGLRVFAEHRDLSPGGSRVEALERAARASENVLFVLSPAYVGCAPVALADGGIAGDLLQRLRRTLLNCPALDDDRALNAVFVDSRVKAWAIHAPQAGSRAQRVNALIDALHEQKNADGTPALALFLWALCDNIDEVDLSHTELDDLARAISGFAPASRSADLSAPYAVLAAVLAQLDVDARPRLLPLLKAECALPPELFDLVPIDFTDVVCIDSGEEFIAWKQLYTALGIIPQEPKITSLNFLVYKGGVLGLLPAAAAITVWLFWIPRFQWGSYFPSLTFSCVGMCILLYYLIYAGRVLWWEHWWLYKTMRVSIRKLFAITAGLGSFLSLFWMSLFLPTLGRPTGFIEKSIFAMFYLLAFTCLTVAVTLRVCKNITSRSIYAAWAGGRGEMV